MLNNAMFTDGFVEALSHALWLAERTPRRLWGRLPGRIARRVSGLVGLAGDPARIAGLLAGLAVALDCVGRLYGLRACEELSAAISAL